LPEGRIEKQILSNIMDIVLVILQIIVALAIIALIAIQGKGGGLGSSFGGGISTFSKRRGIEKFVFNMTIVAGGAFLILSVVSLLL
jgi:preprotein translocase subunit SecG